MGAAELLVRALLEPPGRYPQAQETPILMSHPVRGYALRPGAWGRYRAGGYDAALHIDSSGFRDEPYATALASELRVLALGDSFTMGLGVDATDTWPERLEALLREGVTARASVVNAGVPGYSARQMRMTAEEVMPQLRPQVVVFALNGETYWRMGDPYVYHAGQLVRSSVLPSLTAGPGGLYYSPITRWPWLHALDLWLNQRFELGAHLLHLAYGAYGRWVAHPSLPPRAGSEQEATVQSIRPLFRPVLTELATMHAIARAHGAILLVLLVNPQESDGSFSADQHVYNQIAEDFCGSVGIRVVDPLPRLIATAKGRPVFRRSDDYHWTSNAHRLIAGALYQDLLAERLLTR